MALHGARTVSLGLAAAVAASIMMAAPASAAKSLDTDDGYPTVGTSVTFYGNAPKKVKRTVVIQEFQGAWKTVKKTTSRTNGRYKVRVPIRHAGEVSYRAVVRKSKSHSISKTARKRHVSRKTLLYVQEAEPGTETDQEQGQDVSSDNAGSWTPPGSTSEPAKTPASTDAEVRVAIAEIRAGVDAERNKAGLVSTTQAACLDTFSQFHSKRMGLNYLLAHSSSDPYFGDGSYYYANACRPDGAAQENVVMVGTVTDAKAAATKAVALWMNSAGHKAAILKTGSSYNTYKLGVGAYRAEGGSWMFTMVITRVN